MAAINSIQLLMALKSNNPQQVAQMLIQQNYANDPTMQQLFQMAMRNDVQGVNRFAQQFFAQRGLDMNEEMNKLMSTLNNM